MYDFQFTLDYEMTIRGTSQKALRCQIANFTGELKYQQSLIDGFITKQNNAVEALMNFDATEYDSIKEAMEMASSISTTFDEVSKNIEKCSDTISKLISVITDLENQLTDMHKF